jgi:hypothetical protein
MDFSAYPPELIQEMRNVRKQLVRIASARAPCPNCDASLNHFEAAGVAADAFDFTKDHTFTCTGCGRRLHPQVSLLGGRMPYRWVLLPARRKSRKKGN